MYLNRRINGQHRPADQVAFALICYWAVCMFTLAVTAVTLINTLAGRPLGLFGTTVNLALLVLSSYVLTDTALYYLANHVDTLPATHHAQHRTGRGPKAAKKTEPIQPIEPDELIPAGYGATGPRSHRTGRARHGASHGGRGNTNPT